MYDLRKHCAIKHIMWAHVFPDLAKIDKEDLEQKNCLYLNKLNLQEIAGE